MWFAITDPDGNEIWPIHDDAREARWSIGIVNVKKLIDNGEIIWKKREQFNKEVWVPYTREYAPSTPTRPFSTLWTDLPTTRQTKAHQREIYGAGNEFSTPKPEALIERIFQLASDPGDLVLDSFAGSGTTGAVAHKMGRRWIMVEIGDHADIHIIQRLQKVIDGSDHGGISEAVDWQGGGGFRYYTLAPSLLEKDRWGNWVIAHEYNPTMLAEAMCKHLGFTYAPSQDEAEYWRHGQSSETDFLYVTTQSLTHEALRLLSEEVGPHRTLMICARAFSGNLDSFANLTCRKIPSTILTKCEWGRDDYSLNIAALPEPEAPKPESAGPLFDASDAEGQADG